jgi:uncharacterized membrane protein YraQ (UPF0718 family)/YHS domain-containing protein
VIVTVLGTVTFLTDIGRGCREAFLMFWATLWALVLGFSISGAVQAFVPKVRMQSALGSHRPRAVAKAAGYGMVSSSCSYAATAMARSLFKKGADFLSAMVFMIASTNLVIELGIVMLVLLGWQFMAAEFVGGPIMIVLLAVLGGLVLTPRLIAGARRRVTEPVAGHDHDHAAMSGVSEDRQAELERTPLRAKTRSVAAWSDAAAYGVADVTMLRRELVIGYTVAGFLAVLVPVHVWNALFLHGHGFWTSLENALVGPLIAVLSWVCSIGNVPLAGALWNGGISFGGVIAFIFADLIAMPLILIYRKYYGGALTIRLVALFYALMATAGLLTEGIFVALGIVPTNRHLALSSDQLTWNYTTILNVLFLVVAVAGWWLARHRERFGGGAGYAYDPVCGMQVSTVDAPARLADGDGYRYFCSERCREQFARDADRRVG